MRMRTPSLAAVLAFLLPALAVMSALTGLAPAAVAQQNYPVVLLLAPSETIQGMVVPTVHPDRAAALAVIQQLPGALQTQARVVEIASVGSSPVELTVQEVCTVEIVADGSPPVSSLDCPDFAQGFRFYPEGLRKSAPTPDPSAKPASATTGASDKPSASTMPSPTGVRSPAGTTRPTTE